MPASGVFARTALNVKSGAKSNYSQIINAIVVAIITFVLLPGFTFIPMAVIASILVYVATRMVAAEHFKKLYRYDTTAFWISMAVAGITIASDATNGILIGTLVSLLVFARRLSTAQCNVTINENGQVADAVIDGDAKEEVRGESIVYRFAGDLTYITAKGHIERLQRIQSGKALILNFRNLFYIDVDGIEALDEIFENLERRKQSVFITGVGEHHKVFFLSHAWYHRLVDEQRVLMTTNDALTKVVSLASL